MSEEKKMRSHAANWLEVAERVYHFRRDLLTDAQRQMLQGATGELKKCGCRRKSRCGPTETEHRET